MDRKKLTNCSPANGTYSEHFRCAKSHAGNLAVTR